MLLLDSVLLDEQILSAPFACDLKKCKGACCTMEGGNGAPLQEQELDLIATCVDAALPYLSKRNKDYIEKNGWLDSDEDEYATKCIDNKECVFVFYEEKVAKCALERAFFDGKTEFRKPISCHLFPVRVANFGGTYLHYEKFEECEDAIANGKELGLTVLDTAKSALIRQFGEQWFEAAKAVAEKDHAKKQR